MSTLKIIDYILFGLALLLATYLFSHREEKEKPFVTGIMVTLFAVAMILQVFIFRD